MCSWKLRGDPAVGRAATPVGANATAPRRRQAYPLGPPRIGRGWRTGHGCYHALTAAAMAALRRYCRLAQELRRILIELFFALGAAEVIRLPFVVGSSRGARRFYVHAAHRIFHRCCAFHHALSFVRELWLAESSPVDLPVSATQPALPRPRLGITCIAPWGRSPPSRSRTSQRSPIRSSDSVRCADSFECYAFRAFCRFPTAAPCAGLSRPLHGRPAAP